MEKLISSTRFLNDSAARLLLDHLTSVEAQLGLTEAIFYYDFPTFRDYEDEAYRPEILLLTPLHGVVALYAVPEPSHGQYDRSILQRGGRGAESIFQHFVRATAQEPVAEKGKK